MRFSFYFPSRINIGCYLNKLVECKVKFHQIGEAYESQTVNLHKSASWSSNALQIGKPKTSEMAPAQKGHIISTDVQDLQSKFAKLESLSPKEFVNSQIISNYFLIVINKLTKTSKWL